MNAPLKRKTTTEETRSTTQRKGVALEKKTNKTGLPDQLKAGIENLSGHSMDDVKVHYNSSKPAQLQAHAYAQGNQIHLSPGQEGHLPHEAWHVVQQKQGRVRPTTQLQEKVNINDDESLEKEADVMGAKAARTNPTPSSERGKMDSDSAETSGNVQRKKASSVSVTTEQKMSPQTSEVLQLFLARVRTKKNQETNERYISELKMEGRPPTSEKGGKGDHTVAEAAMEFMLEKLITGQTHNYVAANIVSILSHVEQESATSYKNEGGKMVKIDLGVLKQFIISYQTLVEKDGDSSDINEALETLIEAFVRLWNKTAGAAYNRSSGKTTGGSGGIDEKDSKKQLHMLSEKIDQEGSSPENAMEVATQVVPLIDFMTGNITTIQELAKHAARAIELVISGVPEIEFDYEQIGTTVAERLGGKLGLNQAQESLLDLYIMRILTVEPDLYEDLEQDLLEEISGKKKDDSNEIMDEKDDI